MRFKQFYLLRESPDDARFDIPKNKTGDKYPDKRYDDPGAITIVADESSLFYAISYNRAIRGTNDNNYGAMLHGHLLEAIRDYTGYNDITQRPPNTPIGKMVSRPKQPPYKSFGTMSSKTLQYFKDRYEHGEDVGTRKALEQYPSLILARAWILTNARMGISFWNRKEYITPRILDMMERYARTRNVVPSNIYYDVSGDTYTRATLLSEPDTSSPPNTGYDDIPLHLLPAEKKKAALRKAGAKPKYVGIQNKILPDGD